MADSLPALMTAREVADYFQVSTAWVFSHARGTRRPVLPRLKVGKVVRFTRQAVERFIVEHSGCN